MNTPFQTPQTALGPNRRFWEFVLLFYAAWILRVVLLMPVDYGIETGWLRQCWSQGLRLSLWVLPVLAYLKWVEGVHPAAFLRLNTFPRGRALLFALGIMTGFLAFCAASAILLQGGGLHKLAVMTGADYAGLVFGMSIVAFAEELLFRGFIFQKLRERHSFQRANLMTALMFLAIHWPGWLYMQGPHWGLLSLSAAILVAGWVFGLMMELTRSLWPPILLHLLNNVLSGVLMG